MTIDRLLARDRAVVHELLRSYKLPVEGLDDPHVATLVARHDGRVIGSAAVEIYGVFGLLRSVAVANAARGQHVGISLTSAAIELARTRRLAALYLLTETAAGFFPKFGFVPVSRADIPAEVKQSVEFTSACPARAQAFELRLDGASR